MLEYKDLPGGSGRFMPIPPAVGSLTIVGESNAFDLMGLCNPGGESSSCDDVPGTAQCSESPGSNWKPAGTSESGMAATTTAITSPQGPTSPGSRPRGGC